MPDTIACPVDFVLMDENKARLTAASIFVLTVTFMLTSFWLVPVFLVIDFSARAFKLGKYSLLNLLSGRLIKVFSIKPKMTDQAPKRFAAQIGLLFAIFITICYACNFTMAALLLAIVLAIFALLESAFSFCAGCYVYHFYNKAFKK